MTRPSRLAALGAGVALTLTAGLALGISTATPVLADSTFQAFEGSADSYAIGSSTRIPAALPLPMEMYLPRTRSNIDSQPRAIGYAGVVDVPLGEVVAQFGVPSPLPNYCYAFFPGAESADCGLQPLLPIALGDGVSGGQGRAFAQGDPAQSDGTAAGGSATMSGYQAGAFQFTVGSARSESSSRIVEGVQSNITEVVLQKVDIGGGALKFDEIRATASALTDGRPGGAKATSSLVFNGVTVQGKPAPIPPEFDAAGAAKNMAPLASALAGAGITFQPVEAPTITEAKDGSSAVAEQSGFVFEMVDEATGQGSTFTLAHAKASSYAVPALDAVAPTTTPRVASSAPTLVGPPPASAAHHPVRTPSVAPDAVLPAPAPAPAASTGEPAPDPTVELRAVAPSAAEPRPYRAAASYRPLLDPSLLATTEALQDRAVARFSDLYLVGGIAALALAALALLMGARRAQP